MRVAVICAVLASVTSGVWARSARAAVSPAWSVQPIPNPAGAKDSALSGVSCSSRVACMAVGHFTNRAGDGVPLAERWDGKRWSIEPVPVPTGAKTSLLFDVSCVSRRACVAVGSVTKDARFTVPLAERWNGTGWSVQRSARPAGGARLSYLGGVSCPSARYCIADGYSGNSAGTVGVTLAERWNGAGWLLQRTPQPAGATVGFFTAVSCASSKSCTAVGFFVDRVGAGKPLAQRWNGTHWSIQRTPSPRAATYLQLVGVSCTRQGPCMAAGFFTIVTGIQIMLAEGWNGVRWSIQRTLYPAGATGVQFAGVSCSTPRSCTAVGFFGSPTGYEEALAERWDGTNWAIQPTPFPAGTVSSSLDSVSCTSTTICTAVGSSLNSAGTEVTLAERYS